MYIYQVVKVGFVAIDHISIIKVLIDLPQQGFPKSSRTNCTMYGSSKLTYHQGDLSGLVKVQVSKLKNELVLPSMAFCGIPSSSVLICMGALPAATLSTEKRENNLIFIIERKRAKVAKEFFYFLVKNCFWH